jgi:hypothetical protein
MGLFSEVYHAQKWHKDVDRHTLSPMYDAGNRHYYIDELARLKNGNFIIPVRWLEDNDKNVFADAYAVTFDDQVRVFPPMNIFSDADEPVVCRQCC